MFLESSLASLNEMSHAPGMKSVASLNEMSEVCGFT